MAAITNPWPKTSLFARGSIHALRGFEDCYIVNIFPPIVGSTATPGLGGIVVTTPNNPTTATTWAVAVLTASGTFIIDSLNNFTVQNTP